MSKITLGDVVAYIPAKMHGGKPQYRTLGKAFRDDKDDRISIKIDTLPLSGSGWEGWINIYERGGPKQSDLLPKEVMPDGGDIPF